MTISTTIVKNSYSGDNSTSTFNYTFKVLSSADLKVIIRNASGVEVTKTLTTHYTIANVGNASGGSITFTAGNIPTSTETVVLLRDTDQIQSIDYISNDPFPAETHEEGLDRSVIIAQELQEEVDRSLKLSRTNTMTNTEFTVGPTERANKVLGFDSSGELSVTSTIGENKGNWAAGTAYNVRDIIKDTSTSNIFMVNQAHTSSGSQPLTTNANSAKYDLLVDVASTSVSAAAAATSETNAANSATAAATSETNAANSATASETSRQASVTAQTAAENARTAAQTAQAAAEAALDNFDDRFLGAKTSDPTLDNDGNALTDGALYFDTTLNVMKVYDLGATVWRKIQLTATDQANLNTVAAQISPTNNLGTVAGLNTQISNLSGLSSEITNLNNIRTDISGLNSIQAAVSAVNLNSANINAVKNNETNINTLAGISDLGNLATAHAAVTNVSNNLAGVNSFADRYRIQAGVPSSSNDIGDLVFDTTAQKLKVFDGSSYQLAGSSVNGTSQRFKFTATASQTTFSGNDDDGNSLTYDPLFLDVYLNGVRLVNGSSNDFVATNGTSIVLNSGASAGDILNVVSFGTFSLASIPTTSITSGTLDIARGGTGINSVSGQADKVLKVNSSGNAFVLGQASSPEVYGFIKSFTASTINYTVTHQSVGGQHKYFINGEQQKTLELLEGNTYIFDWSSATSHPFRFSTTSNGTHGGGTEYTTGVTVNTSTYKTTIVVGSSAPTLYYYCQYHSGMGGQANTPIPANNTLQVITTNQGADNITNTQFNSFTDTLFSASGFTFSIDGTTGNLIATI